jgi:hypothetical protein
VVLDGCPTFGRHELVRVVFALENLEALTPLDGHAEVSALLEHRHQLLGFPFGRLKTVDSRHAHRSSLPLRRCPCDIARPVSRYRFRLYEEGLGVK